MQLAGPLRKSATGAVHTLLRDSYSEPYFITWCESPQNECSRHSRVFAPPFHRLGWWTRSSRRPVSLRAPRVECRNPHSRSGPRRCDAFLFCKEKRAVPRVLPPHTPRPDSATSSSVAPCEPPGGAPDSGADPGRRTQRPHSRPQRARGRTLTLPRPHRAVPHRPFRPRSLSVRPFRRTPHAGAT